MPRAGARPAAVNVSQCTYIGAMKKLILILAALSATPAAAAQRTETAVLAGGCFWGMEAVFEHVKGVTDVVSGFAGGSRKDASYDAVSTERTGHAEAVR